MNFKYTPEEAEIAARCEIGVGRSPVAVSSLIAALFTFICLGKVFGLLDVSYNVLLPQVCFACAVILFCAYLEWRIKKTASSIAGREFCYRDDGSSLRLFENDAEICSFKDNDVTTVAEGFLCARLFYGGRSVCLPLRVFAGIVDRIEELGAAGDPGMRIVFKKWL